jgi:purine-binding chemotaxis protein CheW
MTQAKKNNNNNTHVVCFRLDKRLYAIPLKYVDRVLRMVAISPVPEAPEWMMGVIDLQGKVIPVLNLRKRFKMPEQPVHPDNRMIILHHQEKLYAINADEVTQVTETSQMISHHTNDMIDIDQNIPLLYVLRDDDQMIMVLNPEKIIPSRTIKENVATQAKI